jgi:hypothetical protein
MPLTKIQSLGITDGTIVNADINASAAIAGTKLSGAGKVLQVSQQVYSTFTQLNSSTYTDSGLTLSITPASTSSKILVMASIQVATNTASEQLISFNLFRGDSSIRTYEVSLQAVNTVTIASSLCYLDSPATTSATTYKIQWKNSTGAGQYIRLNNYLSSDGNAASTLTLMEIAG